jgi:hypothetical protein
MMFRAASAVQLHLVASEERLMTSRIIALAIACALPVLAVASQADAAAVANGLSVNGLSVNGLSVNGLTHNGLTHNGLTHNGLTYNGLTYNGLTHNGLSVNGASQIGNDAGSLGGRLTGAVLPDGTAVTLE